MPRFLSLGLAIFLLFLAGLFTLQGAYLTLAIPFVVYLLAGFLRGPGEIDVRVERRLTADRAAPGDRVDVTLTVVNRGSLIEELLVEDRLPAGLTVRSGSLFCLMTLSPGASHTWTYTVEGTRGSYVFNDLFARAGDHLAVSSRRVRLQAQGAFFVFPSLVRLGHIAIRPRRTRVYAGMIPARAGGSGIEFFGVRAYQSGDSPRRINWRASARHSGLFANEYQQERVADVGIVLDGRLRTNTCGGSQVLFEHSVGAAASLADAFLSQGDRVGLLLYGNYLDWTVPGYGKIQRERILHALAGARLGDSMIFTALKYIPPRLFPPESQLVIVSPLTGEDLEPIVLLRARGYQVLVVSPDPVSFEVSRLRDERAVHLAARVVRLERGLLLQHLRRAGVQVLDWDVSQPFDRVTRAQLGRMSPRLQGMRSAL
jgi:uncharacterized protein (DUF58 family)